MNRLNTIAIGLVLGLPLLAQEDRPIRYFPPANTPIIGSTCSTITPLVNIWATGNLYQCIGPTKEPNGGQWRLVSTGSGTTLPFVQPMPFSRLPGTAVTGGVTNQVTLSTCPVGVAGADSAHYVYLSGGTGTAEAVLITGGTCTSGATAGTITFTPANSHSGAYTITSATSGIQEAVNFCGYYCLLWLDAVTYEFYAPATINYHISIRGGGQDVTYLHNNSATLGVLRWVSVVVPAGTPFAGSEWSGFTIYSGSKNNTATNTTIADAIYIQDGDTSFNLNHVTIHNHAVGIHRIGGYSHFFSDIFIRFYRDYGILVENNANVTTLGADQYLTNILIQNTGNTGTITDTGCGLRIANFSGIYVKTLTTNSAKYGICLYPRAKTGVETFTHVYYASLDQITTDGSEHAGIYLDDTNGTISAVYINNFISAYNGCLQSQSGCPSVAFANPAPGIWVHAPAAQTKDVIFNNGTSRENGGHGVLVDGSPADMTFFAMNIDSNGQAATNTYDGLHVNANVYDVTWIGGYSGTVNTILARQQRYGAYFGAGGDNHLMQGIRFPTGSNATAAVSYLAGAHSQLTGNWSPEDGTANQNLTSRVAFADLSAQIPASHSVFCTDCTIAGTAPFACLGSGTGAWAFYNPTSASWKCPF